MDTLVRCPLRWLLERHGGTDPAQLAAVTGTLVHALAQSAADGADTGQLRAELDAAWTRVDAGAPWFSRRERRRVESMVWTFLDWLRTSRAELTGAAVEQEMRVALPPEIDTGQDGDGGGRTVWLTGRVDRLEHDAYGRPVIVDLKTGKTPISTAEAEKHPQLAAYQLALRLGAFDTGGATAPGDTGDSGGARLVYVAKPHTRTGATQREQPALDDEAARRWLDVVRTAAAESAGPEYPVRENSDCDRCPARPACPLRPEGRQVTHR